MTTVERLAEWAHGLRSEALPEDVLALCRTQRRSVLAAVAAGSANQRVRRVLAGLEAHAPDGPAPLLGTKKATSVETALYGAAVSSVALDFDDYVCFGHTGHSSVLTPLLLATEHETKATTQLVAQVAANEIEAR